MHRYVAAPFNLLGALSIFVSMWSTRDGIHIILFNHSSALKIRHSSWSTSLRYKYSLHPLHPPIDRYTGPMRVQPLFTFGKIDNIQGARVREGRGQVFVDFCFNLS
jgi:hypothetical protein